MAVAYVQSKSISSTGTTATTIAVTMTNPVAAGNTMAVFCQWNNLGPSAFVSCLDTPGNTYTPVDQPAQFGGDLCKTLYAKNIIGGACTVTVTISPAAGYRLLVVHEISGCDLSVPLDQHIINSLTNPGTGANAITSTAKTTTTNGQYIFGGTTVHNVGATKTIAAGTGFTGRESINGGADSCPLESEEQIQTSAGSIAATFTGTGTAGDDVSCALMTFIASVGGGGGGGNNPLMAQIWM